MTNQTPDPLLQLSDLLDCMLEGRVPPESVRRWLAAGILATLDGTPMEKALGLKRRGQQPMRVRILQHQRDMYLMQAIRAASFDPNRSLSDWEKCKRLAPLLNTWRQHSWPREQDLDSPPRGLVWKLWAWHAARIDDNLPSDTRALYEVVNRVRANQYQPLPRSLLTHLMSQPCNHNASKSSDLSAAP